MYAATDLVKLQKAETSSSFSLLTGLTRNSEFCFPSNLMFQTSLSVSLAPVTKSLFNALGWSLRDKQLARDPVERSARACLSYHCYVFETNAANISKPTACSLESESCFAPKRRINDAFCYNKH